MGKEARPRTDLSGKDLTQLPAQDLAGGGPRQCVDKVDLPRLLVGGEAFGYESAELFFQLSGCDRTFAKDDKGDRNLSRGLVRASDHAAIPNRWVFEQQSFNLGRCDREAFVFDHLLAAIDDVIKVVGVTCDDIAGPEPS